MKLRVNFQVQGVPLQGMPFKCVLKQENLKQAKRKACRDKSNRLNNYE